ncbi:MAG: phosphotriesterase, partial [Thermoleophilaceae bacterium]|nr:phosphotriesterase [Thermoleophilaceae bacterium]
DARFLAQAASTTGMNIVACTGLYRYNFLPQIFEGHDEDFLADCFVHDIEEGIQGTASKAAFIKNAVDEPGITPGAEKALRAGARASKRTGRPIMCHTHPGTKRGSEVLDLYEEEGVDLSTVMLAHTGDTDDLDHIEELLARGAWIGMDRYGLDIILPQEKRNATVAALCERGYADRMFLSQDACSKLDWFPEEMQAQMAPKWTMTLIFDEVLGELRELGVTDEQIDQMLVANPPRWIAGS